MVRGLPAAQGLAAGMQSMIFETRERATFPAVPGPGRLNTARCGKYAEKIKDWVLVWRAMHPARLDSLISVRWSILSLRVSRRSAQPRALLESAAPVFAALTASALARGSQEVGGPHDQEQRASLRQALPRRCPKIQSGRAGSRRFECADVGRFWASPRSVIAMRLPARAEGCKAKSMPCTPHHGPEGTSLPDRGDAQNLSPAVGRRE